VSRRREASPDRIVRYSRGHVSELLAAALLIAKGYRILARRHRTPMGEIDLIARRGRRLAFVEVKRRPTWAEAEAAITPRQGERVRRAAEAWVARHPAYRDHELGFDVVLLAAGHWPRHIANALNWPGDTGLRRR
jgi:putative endonuclease